MASDFMKVARAVDGDDWWVIRLKVACEFLAMEYTRDLALFATLACVDSIDVDDNMTVSTQRVTDTEIIDALEAWRVELAKREEREEPDDPLDLKDPPYAYN